MNPLVRNVLAVLAGVVVGTITNMGIVVFGGVLIPGPEGADTTTVEGLREAMTLFTPRHFVFPFLAHALGTLAGAFVAAWLAASHSLKLALVIGLWFLLGGCTMIAMCGGPLWFIVLDLGLAYLPMAWLGGSWGQRMRRRRESAPASTPDR